MLQEQHRGGIFALYDAGRQLGGRKMTAAARGPLPAILELRTAAIALDVLPEHETGLIVIQPRSWPRPTLRIAPEVALEMAQLLVAAVADLIPRKRP
jgi:hypothetical protein